MGNIETLIRKEAVSVKRLIPTDYRIIERPASAEFIKAYGKLLKFPKYIPKDFTTIELSILVPRFYSKLRYEQEDF